MTASLTPSSRIIIVGAGVFGLSTSLHLARQGYKDVTVFDLQPYADNHYDPDEGCDAASADANKVYRCSYGDEKEYQDLAFSGRKIWQSWNDEIATTPAERLPPGITPQTKLYENNGLFRLAASDKLSKFDEESLASLEASGLRHFQHVIKDEADLQRLAETDKAAPGQNWVHKATLFNGTQWEHLNGFLDTSAGLTYADKACTWAQHLAAQAGVKFVFGPKGGKLQSLISSIREDGSTDVSGIRTADGIEHPADLVVVACGGWTPSIIPGLQGTLETSAGSVVTVQLPANRQDLWDKYSPEKFPVFVWGAAGHVSTTYSNLYSFPRTDKGQIKIGYRGRKWTNYQESDITKERLSVPTTAYTEHKTTNLPKIALDAIQRWLGEFLPDLAALGIAKTRLCWYTDSNDNNFVIDYVPNYNKTLFVASGGSGHGFKFLPVLGQHVINQLVGHRDQFTDLWKFRKSPEGVKANGLEEGEGGERVLAKLEMATESDWNWVK